MAEHNETLSKKVVVVVVYLPWKIEIGWIIMNILQQTDWQTDKGFSGCLEILTDLISIAV